MAAANGLGLGRRWAIRYLGGLRKRELPEQDQETTTMVDWGPCSKQKLAGHTTSPITVDWDGDGVPDLLIGAEDGRIYFMKHRLPKLSRFKGVGLEIEGLGFRKAILANGEKAYNNREYS